MISASSCFICVTSVYSSAQCSYLFSVTWSPGRSAECPAPLLPVWLPPFRTKICFRCCAEQSNGSAHAPLSHVLLFSGHIPNPCALLKGGDASIVVYKHTHTYKLSLPLSSASAFGRIVLAACFCRGHRARSQRPLRLPLRGRHGNSNTMRKKMSKPSVSSLRQSKSWHITQRSHSQG